MAHAGVAGWPMASLAITTICALPLLAALDQALDAVVPSKFDDHRNDGPTPAAV